VRVAGIHTAAVKETLTPEKVGRTNPAMTAFLDQILENLPQQTMLGRLPGLQSVADTAAFLASDRASNITSGHVNATCGMVPG
jgi:NAD(P)-dependent dehydrogenase (short-subunit alcohol dehydrogenase family)